MALRIWVATSVASWVELSACSPTSSATPAVKPLPFLPARAASISGVGATACWSGWRSGRCRRRTWRPVRCPRLLRSLGTYHSHHLGAAVRDQLGHLLRPLARRPGAGRDQRDRRGALLQPVGDVAQRSELGVGAAGDLADGAGRLTGRDRDLADAACLLRRRALCADGWRLKNSGAPRSVHLCRRACSASGTSIRVSPAASATRRWKAGAAVPQHCRRHGDEGDGKHGKHPAGGDAGRNRRALSVFRPPPSCASCRRDRAASARRCSPILRGRGSWLPVVLGSTAAAVRGRCAVVPVRAKGRDCRVRPISRRARRRPAPVPASPSRRPPRARPAFSPPRQNGCAAHVEFRRPGKARLAQAGQHRRLPPGAGRRAQAPPGVPEATFSHPVERRQDGLFAAIRFSHGSRSARW